MTVSRRHFLQGLAAIPAAAVFSPTSIVQALAPPMMMGGTRNIVMLDLRGGNDGYNTVVPYGMANGAYASEFRSSLAVPQNKVLALDGQVGLHSAMAELKTHFDAGRLAVIHGVGYPQPDFSHEVSQQIWQTGDPSKAASTGWLGRHIESLGVPATPNAMSVSSSVQPLLKGAGSFVPAFQNIGSVNFPADPYNWNDGPNRRAAYLALAQASQLADGEVAAMGQTSESILDLIDLISEVPEFTHVGEYSEDDEYFNMSLQLVVRLLASGIGMHHFHVLYGGFDTHSAQNKDDFHERRLAVISKGLSAMHADLASVGLAQDTVFVVFSEFGRTVYQNGSNGTDHGSVNPVLILGDQVVGGQFGAHPSMEVDDLTEYNEFPMSVDLRDVFGTVVDRWLGGSANATFPGHSYSPMGFFAST